MRPSSAHDKPLFHLSPQDPVTIKQSFEGISDDVINALMSLIEARERGGGPYPDPYWQAASKQLLECDSDLLGIKGSPSEPLLDANHTLATPEGA